jgi:hypothetical protein
MLIYSHPHEDSLSFAHFFSRDLRVSSQRHGGAPSLLPLCACLHLRDDDGVGFHELCILLHELRGDDNDFHLRILLLHELRGDDFHHHELRVGLLHGTATASTFTTTTSASASSTTERQGPERVTTSSIAAVVARVLLLYDGGAGAPLWRWKAVYGSGLDEPRSRLCFFKIIFCAGPLNKPTS